MGQENCTQPQRLANKMTVTFDKCVAVTYCVNIMKQMLSDVMYASHRACHVAQPAMLMNSPAIRLASVFSQINHIIIIQSMINTLSPLEAEETNTHKCDSPAHGIQRDTISREKAKEIIALVFDTPREYAERLQRKFDARQPVLARHLNRQTAERPYRLSFLVTEPIANLWRYFRKEHHIVPVVRASHLESAIRQVEKVFDPRRNGRIECDELTLMIVFSANLRNTCPPLGT